MEFDMDYMYRGLKISGVILTLVITLFVVGMANKKEVVKQEMCYDICRDVKKECRRGM